MSNKARSRQPSGPPPRSLYRKIQLVLSEAQRRRTSSVPALIEQIQRRGHVDFTRYRVRPGGTVQVVPCSSDSITRVVEICIDLGLLDQSSAPTGRGKQAVASKHFDPVLRNALEHGLDRLGMPLNAIHAASEQLLRNASTGNVPTWDAIYEHLGGNNNGRIRDRFRCYLALLSVCSGIKFSRKKIYLP